MRLSKTAVLALRGHTKQRKAQIASKLDMSVNTLYRLINENQDNGDLTKVKALQVISEETGLEQSQILEQDTLEDSLNKERQS